MIKKYAGLIVTLLAFAGLLTVYIGSFKFLKVTKKTIQIPSSDSEVDGLKLLQIADLHANNPEKVHLNIWKEIDSLDFDAVLITGDIVDRNAYQIEPHLPYIADLATKKPVFFAEGNHDHYSMKKLRPLLEDAGVVVLVDEKSEFTYNGKPVTVIGLPDFYTTNFTDSRKLLAENDGFRIVMMHQPQHIDYLGEQNQSGLFLSGHTHGGQIRLPFLPCLFAPAQGLMPKYGYLEYSVGNAKLFVSKGVGYTGKAPLRFWNRPEVCLLTLSAEKE